MSAKERLFRFRRSSTLSSSNTSVSPEDFIVKGDTESGIKAVSVMAQPKEDFNLGRGHVMAIAKLLRGGAPNKV